MTFETAKTNNAVVFEFFTVASIIDFFTSDPTYKVCDIPYVKVSLI